MLKDRISEHQRNVNQKKELSQIYQHCRETGHDIQFNDVTILASKDRRCVRQFFCIILKQRLAKKSIESINRHIDIPLTMIVILEIYLAER